MNKKKFFLYGFIITGIICQLNVLIPNFVKSNTPESILVYDKNGEVIYMGLTSDEKYRKWQKIEKISKKFKETIVLKEDKYFYYHFGFNPISILRSTKDLLWNKKAAGASTITMQLARLYFQLETKSIKGKIQQILSSIFLEVILSKDEIFEAYLNLIPMGRNIQGVETASLYYLNKASAELSSIESSFFSLLPQRPSRIKYVGDNRVSLLAEKLHQSHKSFTLNEIESFLKGLKLNTSRVNLNPHFNNYILTQTSANHIYSTLDQKLDISIRNILKSYVEKNNRVGIQNATTVIVNAKTGNVLSYIASKDFYDNQIHGQVDGLRSKRSPGSTLKPFIYALAFDQGLYIPKSILFDAPLAFRTPENYDRRLKGPITLEEALITSRNIPAVYVASKIKSPNLYDLLTYSNISQMKKESHYGSSLALGGLELTSLELASLYVMLANNGKFKELNLLNKKESPVIELISPAASIMVKDILSKNPRPKYLAHSQFLQKRGNIYWKTGTSFGFRDAWAAGIWGDYVIVSWVGDFKSKSNPYFVGSITAAPLFFKIIDYLRTTKHYKHMADLKHTHSSELNEVDVCTVSGKIPNKYCPHKVKSLFIPGRSPIHKCESHRELEVSVDNGLRSCAEYKGKTIKKVFEFFSTSKLKTYKEFGLKLTLPPDYEAICKKKAIIATKGFKPNILSPKIGYTYMIDKSEDKAAIPLQAKTDSDVLSLSWYINNRLVSKSKPNKFVMLNLPAGYHKIEVVDDKGRSSKRLLTIKPTL